MSSVTPKRIAVAQLCTTSDKVANLVGMAKCAGWSMASKSHMMFLPEACGFLGQSAAETYANAETSLSKRTNAIINPEWLTNLVTDTVKSCAEGEINKDPEQEAPDYSQEAKNMQDISILEGLRTIARASGIFISVGGLHVQVEDKDDHRVYNTHLILDEKGGIQAEYRKIHLFDVSIPGQVQLRESNSTAPGRAAVLCESPIGKKLVVCE